MSHADRRLIEACAEGDPHALVAALNEGARPSVLDAQGAAQLFAVCAEGHVECARALIAARARLDDRTGADQCTALMSAAKRGFTAVVRLLVDAGARPDLADADGCTALMAAALNGRTESARILIDARAQLDHTLYDPTDGGWSALMLACASCHVPVARALIDARADLELEDPSTGRTALALSMDDGYCLESCSYALGSVCSVRRWCAHEMVRLLIDAGAQLEHSDKYGRTPLHVAYGSSWSRAPVGGVDECTRLLLEAGANVQATDAQGRGVLAAKPSFSCTSLPTAKFFCAYGARASDLDPIGLLRHPGMAAWLAETARWTTPLHHFDRLRLSAIESLLLAGADVHASDGAHAAPSPLSLAREALRKGCYGSQCAAAKLLLSVATTWSPSTHRLFPEPARTHALKLLLVGRRLADGDGPLATSKGALFDVWQAHVMPRVVLWCALRWPFGR
jgi:ankyrin repeat protein